MNGRTRHLLVDTQGFPLKVVASAADVRDREGAPLLAQALRLFGPDLPRLALVWADAAYRGPWEQEPHDQMGWTLEIVARPDDQPKTAFRVQPHRWIVARTFAWFGGCRRLAKDYEYHLESSEALIYAAMSHLLLRRLRRLTRPPSSPPG